MYRVLSLTNTSLVTEILTRALTDTNLDTARNKNLEFDSPECI